MKTSATTLAALRKAIAAAQPATSAGDRFVSLEARVLEGLLDDLAALMPKPQAPTDLTDDHRDPTWGAGDHDEDYVPGKDD